MFTRTTKLVNRIFHRSIDLNICRRFASKILLNDINRFGKLEVYCPNLKSLIKPIDPFEVPDGNQAAISIFKHDGCCEDDVKDFVDVDYDEKTSVVSVTEKNSAKKTLDMQLRIEIPHNFDIDTDTLSIDLLETEGDVIKIRAELDSMLGKIKSDNIDVHIRNGGLTCKSLFGNGKVFSKGNVSVLKVQSQRFDVSSNEDIHLSSAYCGQLKCYTENGKIDLGSVHGNSFLEGDSGLISITALAGDTNIQTKSGDISVAVDSCSHVFLSSEQGNIDVGLADSVSAFLEAQGVLVDVPEDLLFDGIKRTTSSGVVNFEGKFGNGVNSIYARTHHGTVSFLRKSWFSKFDSI